jgi:hypothetical protein
MYLWVWFDKDLQPTGEISVSFTRTNDINAASERIISMSKTGLSLEAGLFNKIESLDFFHALVEMHNH